MKENISSKIFYHIYPLGMCGAALTNDFSCPPGDGIRRLASELDRIASLGVNALYIGPLFESSSHGYDTADYYHVDRRLGSDEDFRNFVACCHSRGISVVADAVFNHTGRDFFAFRDIVRNRENSRFRGWYRGLNFGGDSPYHDGFSYEGWAGCMDLVKLDVDNPDVREHIFGAVGKWISEFGIDGLRLDAADVLSPAFMDALSSFCASRAADFWLMGEVVHGDYNNWARPFRLDSVTNYELYKGLWSSFNDGNFFELAWSLNRQSGENGIYRNIRLYNFADNHDVNRVASVLHNQAWLFPLYGILFTVPGIPSVYYGSEHGILGVRGKSDDFQLRPPFGVFSPELPEFARPRTDSPALEAAIRKFSGIRKSHQALTDGDYRQIFVAPRQFAFARSTENERILVAVNSAEESAVIKLPDWNGRWEDILNGEVFDGSVTDGLEIPPSWLRIMRRI